MDRLIGSRRAGAIAVAAVAIILAGCGAGQTGAGASAGPSAAPATAGASAAGSGAALEIGLVHDATLGDHLTGKDGRTLYLLTKDTPGVSTCTDKCATTWPPFTLDKGEAAIGGAGVTGTVATITRADGSMQVTYNGAPLYYFSGDTAAGDAKGQGMNDVWFVVSAAGGPGGMGASPAPTTGGYSY